MTDLSRRAFFTTLAAAAAPRLGGVRLQAESLEIRALEFDHLHTGERLSVEYFDRGTYLPDALETVNHFLRDFRTGDVHEIDPRLLDVLHRVTGATGSTRPYQVISGYRSPATNEMLRQRNEGVAVGSLHMVGQAIDVRLGDVPLPELRNAALTLRLGGVGYYPASDFVHIDTGRVRRW